MQNNGGLGELGPGNYCAGLGNEEGNVNGGTCVVLTGGGSGGRGRRPGTLAGSPGLYINPCCKVDGCLDDLSLAGEYHRRHRVCKAHASAPSVLVEGQEQRFCQQCSRFHSLAEFDEGKKSCRKRLAGHNERRRRQQPDPIAMISPSDVHVSTVEEVSSSKRACPGYEWRGTGSVESPDSDCKGPTSKVCRGEHERPAKVVEISKADCYLLQRPAKSGEECSDIFNDPFEELISRGDTVNCKEKGRDILRLPSLDQSHLQVGVGLKKNRIHTEQSSSVPKEGLDLGDDLVLPVLPIKRNGVIFYLKKQPLILEDSSHIRSQRYPIKDLPDKKAWQKEDDTAFFHCLWECPKVQPVWRWAGRQLSKLQGSKVTLEWKQAICGEKLGTWATSDILSVWKLLRSTILGQIWHARKSTVYSGLQWSSGQVIKATWVDLMMYAMKDWLEVLKAKGSVQNAEANELWARFDNKWLLNKFAGKRVEWGMSWKDPNDVLLD